MGIDLGNLGIAELKKLAGNVEKAIAAAEAKRRKEAKAAVDKIAKEYGVSVDELLAVEKRKPARKKKTTPSKGAAAPKYRNPADPKQTWTGKGRRPKWFVDAVAAGKSEADLSV